VTLLLALDTSTANASLALFDGERVLSETTWLAGREHSTRLLVEVQVALERIGRAQEELSGIVVARGPGSYTGVRVGLAVAKGIAAGLGVPAWGIGSLDVLALMASGVEVPVCAALEAGRGRYATAVYERGELVESARLLKTGELAQAIVTPTFVIGELAPDARDALAQNPYVRLAPVAAAARRAGFLAEAGWRLSQTGDPGNSATLDAVYVS
jgi:tRNA threonylcarbamoyladenosine biosynthesis protein TsaB